MLFDGGSSVTKKEEDNIIMVIAGGLAGVTLGAGAMWWWNTEQAKRQAAQSAAAMAEAARQAQERTHHYEQPGAQPQQPQRVEQGPSAYQSQVVESNAGNNLEVNSGESDMNKELQNTLSDPLDRKGKKPEFVDEDQSDITDTGMALFAPRPS